LKVPRNAMTNPDQEERPEDGGEGFVALAEVQVRAHLKKLMKCAAPSLPYEARSQLSVRVGVGSTMAWRAESCRATSQFKTSVRYGRKDRDEASKKDDLCFLLFQPVEQILLLLILSFTPRRVDVCNAYIRKVPIRFAGKEPPVFRLVQMWSSHTRLVQMWSSHTHIKKRHTSTHTHTHTHTCH